MLLYTVYMVCAFMCVAVHSCTWVHVLTCCYTHMEVRGQSRCWSSLLPCPVQSLPPTLPSAYTRLLGSGPSGFSCLCLPITVGDWCHRQAVTGFTRLLGMWTQVLVFIWQAHTALSHDPTSPFHFEASSTRLIVHPCYTLHNARPPPMQAVEGVVRSHLASSECQLMAPP